MIFGPKKGPKTGLFGLFYGCFPGFRDFGDFDPPEGRIRPKIVPQIDSRLSMESIMDFGGRITGVKIAQNALFCRFRGF